MESKKWALALVAAALAVSGTWFGASPAQAATGLIGDPGLRECIADAMSSAGAVGTPGSPDYDGLVAAVTQADLDAMAAVGVEELWCYGVDSLAGLENYHGTALTTLTANFGGITDLAPVAALTSLTALDLGSNEITSVSALSSLTGLTGLSLESNRISGVAALAGLTALEFLNLGDNAIRDITPLAGLRSLMYLGLARNDVTDLSPLAGLTGLIYLSLDGNGLADLAPLAALTGLRGLSLDDNRVTSFDMLGALTELALTPADPAFRGLLLGANNLSDYGQIASTCTKAQVNSYFADPDTSDLGCLLVIAPFQFLTATATAGSPVALPEVTGQPDDPLTWHVVQGTATITAGGRITYPAAGKFVLRFEGSAVPGTNFGYAVASIGQAACALQGGTWGRANGVEGLCSTARVFSGIVTVTVSAGTSGGGDAIVETGGAVAPSGVPLVAVVLTVAGLALAARRPLRA